MKYSIVMPTYNVSDYLSNSISDILRQTYSNFELILIDDASTDNSGKMADSWASKDNRIIVKHLGMNQGLSNARNEGLNLASGDYVLFLDPDDRYEVDLLKNIENSLLSNKATVVLYGLTEEYFDEEETLFFKKNIVPEDLYLNTVLDVRNKVIHLESKTLFGYAWNKAYDIKYLKSLNIVFEKVPMIEDVLFNIEVFRDLDSLNLISKPMYHYAIRNNRSLTHKFLPEYFQIHENRIRALIELHRQWGMDNDFVLNLLGSIYCRYFVSAIQRNCDPRANMKFKDRRKWIKSKFQSDVYGQLKNNIRPQNIVMKFMSVGIRIKNITLCQIVGRGIYIIKTSFPNMFSKLKQNR